MTLDMNAIVNAGMMVAAWAGVWLTSRQVVQGNNEKLKASIADAIKIGILEARKEFIEEVENKFVPLGSCVERKKEEEKWQGTCLDRLNRIDQELAALRRDHGSLATQFVTATLSVVSAVQLIASHVHLQTVVTMLDKTEQQLRDML